MFIYTTINEKEGGEFIIGVSEYKFDIITPIRSNIENPINDYDSHKIYDFETGEEINDITVILNDFKEYQYKMIINNINSLPLIGMAHSKMMYLSYLYQINSIEQSKSFKGSLDEMFQAINNNEITPSDNITLFKKVYPIAMNFKYEIIDKLDEFDKKFINSTNNYDTFHAIIGLNDLAVLVSNPYEFMKTKIYK